MAKNINFELFACRKLLEKYVEDYIDMINRIQKERESRKSEPIRIILSEFICLPSIIEAHWVLSCGMEWEEVNEKLNDWKIRV